MPDVHDPRLEALADISEGQRVELDEHPVLRGGGEPFSLIMSTVREVPEGHVLRLRAMFRPVPFLDAMRARGRTHWVEHGEDDDWIVWFYRTRDAA